MKRLQLLRPKVTVLTELFICFIFLGGHSSIVMSQSDEYVAGELLVKLRAPAPSLQSTAKLKTKLGIPSLDKLNQSLAVAKIESVIKSSFLVANKPERIALDRLFKVTFSDTVLMAAALEAYRRDPNVEYVQPNYLYKIHSQPDDPLFDQQEALHIIQAADAWEIQLASPDIIVGVVDTGIDGAHEDLQAVLWLNSGEDLNRNGRVDSTDFNGIDDDGNGFIDDLRGWDFTDAPSFPDGGDFRTPDNDPSDENGHGTSVAGLIGADGNNGIGIAGLAYGCRIMNLRAGTALGFLEEDDVASAIVYAVENGADIINMSFGDDVASPLLHDVMEFAYAQNCVLVASAGNSNTDKIHFPSGFSQTISVGATDKSDVIAGFSNYGSSVDVVAPGVNILTTQRGDRYRDFSGTSASAPLVSALAALLLSKNPDLSNEAVKGLILSTTDDLGDIGWDNLYASGRINAFKAAKSSNFLIVRIDSPALDQGFAGGTLSVRGTALGAFLESYALEIGVGETPAEWNQLTLVNHRQILDEPIRDIDLSAMPDDVYTLRLIAQNRDGTTLEDKVRFFIDRTPPVISGVMQTSMLDGDRSSFLLEFETDDLCNAGVHYRPQGSEQSFKTVEIPFHTKTHRFHFTQNIFFGELEFFIEAVNGSGLMTKNDNQDALFQADLSSPPVGGVPIERLSLSLPSAFLLGRVADFDGDGAQEAILSRYDSNFNFGPLTIFEFRQNHFEEVWTISETLIPRDWGDSDGDGLLEILAGRGAHSFILEAPVAGAFPSQIVWSDSGDVWASRFADLDRDGLGEVILRIDDVFTVWETIGDNEYAQVASLPNLTDGHNIVGVPHSEIGDFDGDGSLEILLGDFDGDVYIYENRGDNLFELTWSDRLPLVDAIDYLSTGDYDGDGIDEFVAGCHSDPSLNTESEFDSRHWLFRVYKRDGDNSFKKVWQQAFFGFQSPLQFDAGVASGDVDNDGRPEILLNLFPDFYLVDFDPDFETYRVIWHDTPNRSNSNIVADFDNDGHNEFYFNNGVEIAGNKFLSNFTGPRTPLGLQARPLDTNVVELSWQAAGVFDEFRIYRGAGSSDSVPIALVTETSFLDSTVTTNVEYQYAITTLDSSVSPVESLLTPSMLVRPGAKPFVEHADYLHPNQIRVSFSEVMNSSVKDHTNFEIKNVGTPQSSIFHRSGQEVLITSPETLAPGDYTIVVNNVEDLDRTPIDTSRNSASFQVSQQHSPPYLVSAALRDQDSVQLEFNEAMDFASVSEIENYTIEPNIKITAASVTGEAPKTVILQIDSKSPIGPFGIEYLITVKNVKSQRGVLIQPGEGNVAALTFNSSDLSNVFAYPNPYRGNSSRGDVIIAGLTQKATVRILDASGRLLRTLEETDGNGGIRWDLKDESGNNVPSGIYLFYVIGEGKRGLGKLAVVR